MTAFPHESPAERRRSSWLWLPEVWASLAIGVIWLAVALTAVFGPDIVSDSPGGSTSRVPSAVVVAICATIASWVIAKYGLREHEHDQSS